MTEKDAYLSTSYWHVELIDEAKKSAFCIPGWLYQFNDDELRPLQRFSHFRTVDETSVDWAVLEDLL